ncbi:MAG: haloacid dehalogenase-like hydrolase [Mycobacteriaceae bacterium]|nr:haloacid dehalogenase-like hydrolase [Mycobacteriaceae bacterium]
MDFVARVSTPGGADFVDIPDRVAVFDNDGTLWCEKPMPIQLDFLLGALRDSAAEDPSLRGRQPWKAACERDSEWLGAAMVKHYNGDDSDLALLKNAVTQGFDAVAVEDYARQVHAFFDGASHPTLGIGYRECGYLPMAGLLRYLEANGFTTYIASGGDRDFMRPIAGELYSVPPERIIGSALGITFEERDGHAELRYRAALEFFDDGPEKPVRIWSRIGRRPIIAVGNANGDLPMLAFAGARNGPALRIVIRHDDPEREFDYTAGAEQLLDAARQRGWTVASMRADWAAVFGAGHP